MIPLEKCKHFYNGHIWMQLASRLMHKVICIEIVKCIQTIFKGKLSLFWCGFVGFRTIL